MSVESMAIVLHHSPSSGTDKVVLLGIANHDGDGGAWPSIATLAKYANVAERNVQAAVKRLEESGQITRHVQDGGTRGMRNGQRPNRYTIELVCPAECDRTTNHRMPTPVRQDRGDASVTPDASITPTPDADVTPTGDAGITQTIHSTTHEPSGSAARSAATAEPGETSSSSNSPVTREAAAAGDHVDASRDGRGRQRMHPADILDGMMLNPDEAGRFRAWLVDATGATNPDGLVVSLHGSGLLSERLSQWRASESAPAGYGAVQAPATPRPGRLEWCGRCDQHTRMLTGHDQDGTEYLRRCPACHVMAGIESPGAGAHHVIAMQAEQAARATGAGRAAFQAARAALPAGTPRRDTTIGTTIDPTTARKMAESEHGA